MKHLVKNGLDTVSYVQNPRDPNKVVSMVDQHSLFSREQGIAAGEAVEMHYNAYGHSNSENAATFLLNSIDASLVTQVEEGCGPTDNFVTHWMHLMHATRSVSLDRFNAIKVRFTKRDVRQFEGENIAAAATEYLQDYKELHSAAEFDFNLLSALLEALCREAGGSEDFKYPLRAIISKLDQTLLDTRHLTYEARTRVCCPRCGYPLHIGPCQIPVPQNEGQRPVASNPVQQRHQGSEQQLWQGHESRDGSHQAAHG